MNKKVDLAALFGVSGIITKKTLVQESREDVLTKTPAEIVDDITELLAEVTDLVGIADIDGVILRIEAIGIRQDCLLTSAIEIKKMMDKL